MGIPVNEQVELAQVRISRGNIPWSLFNFQSVSNSFDETWRLPAYLGELGSMPVDGLDRIQVIYAVFVGRNAYDGACQKLSHETRYYCRDALKY